MQADLDRGEHSRLALRGSRCASACAASRCSRSTAPAGAPTRSPLTGTPAPRSTSRASSPAGVARRSSEAILTHDATLAAPPRGPSHGAADAHVRPRRRRVSSPRPARRGPPRHLHRTGGVRKTRLAVIEVARAAPGSSPPSPRPPPPSRSRVDLRRAGGRPCPPGRGRRRGARTASSYGSPRCPSSTTSRTSRRWRRCSPRLLSRPPHAAPAGHEPAAGGVSEQSGCTRSPRCPRPPAVELFAARARSRDPAFGSATRTRRAFVRRCAERLGGPPLALELAAARLGARPALRRSPGAGTTRWICSATALWAPRQPPSNAACHA